MPTPTQTSPEAPARSRAAVTPARWLTAGGALLLAAAAWRLRHAAGERLWLDELYTLTLIGTPSLPHVWDGALRGVDGNPPLYLSLAWLLTRARGVAPEAVLASFNLLVVAATAALLYRIGRRLADPLSVVAGLAGLAATDGMVVYALLEIRTYALYLFLVTAALWGALRVMDRPTPGRTAALAALGTLATLAHSFGGFYVLAILSGAGLVALVRRDRAQGLALAAAACPAILALGLWIRISLAAQLAVASPYGWIPVPGTIDLLIALTGSLGPTLLAAASLTWWASRSHPRLRDLARLCRDRPDVAAVGAVMVAFAVLTVAAWIGAHIVTPFFVPRYFIPNVVVPGLLAGPALATIGRRVDRRLFAVLAAVCVAMAATAIVVDPGPSRLSIPCLDADGGFLEDGLAADGTPVIAESPHAWFPRARYAPAQATLYPLDWDVVLGFPNRARNNAMDFHIMEILRDWAAPGTPLASRILTTAAITERHRHVLVLDEDARGWFTRLRATVPLTARLLREAGRCHIWDVTLGGSAGP